MKKKQILTVLLGALLLLLALSLFSCGEKETYTITFMANGAVVDTRTYQVGDERIDEPTAPAFTYGYYGEGASSWSPYTLDGGDKTVYAVTSRQTQAQYTLVGDVYHVTGCNGLADGKLEVLSEYNGKPVTAIGERALQANAALTSVVLPAGMERIEKAAFLSCRNLAEISLPATLTYVGQSAFMSCTALTSLEIPATVQTVDDQAFAICKALSTVTLAQDAQLKTIGEKAFYECPALTSFTVPASVVRIEKNAFSFIPDWTDPVLPMLLSATPLSSDEEESVGLERVIFAQPNGWSCGDVLLSATDLSDPVKAAQFLKETYKEQDWTRA